MSKRKFKAETKQLLDLMIHSIYTHKEIFLRELISNASDALDKQRFKTLTADGGTTDGEELAINISLDKETKTLTISDNGIGMTQDEVVENIGTIAKSGSREFFEKLKDAKEHSAADELIGRFGVGFYSAFMVADSVTLLTKSVDCEKGVKWESAGDGSYTIDEYELEERGTIIILHLHEDAIKDLNLLDNQEIQRLVKRYSDFITSPIKMDFTIEKPEEKDDDGKVVQEAATEIENRTLNSMKPIWKRNKSDVTDEEYTEFFKQGFSEWEDPADVVHINGEGAVEFTALIFLPGKAPMDYYSSQFERGLKLYSRSVFIMEKCKELLPEYLGFIKGLVDSPDFTLNISREVLQHDRQLAVIAKNIEKKVLRALSKMLKNDREKYIVFWKEFGRALKAGVYAEYGANKEKLQDLLLFESNKSESVTTLAEYVERMPEGQQEIYYAPGKDKASIDAMPQMEKLKEKEYEVLYFTDKIDEFTSVTLAEYKEKKLRSIAGSDLNLDTEEEKKEHEEKLKETKEENKGLLEKMKELLKDKVSDVEISDRLTTSPVCLVSKGEGFSLNMEQVLAEANMGGMPVPKAQKVLELNPNHQIFSILNGLYDKGEEGESLLAVYAELLYGQSLLIEGLPLDNPAEIAHKMVDIMVSADKK
ncbi:molecular chaperone HtpG [bacterium]|nr:molecular chaperone HtpG [bacterium]